MVRNQVKTTRRSPDVQLQHPQTHRHGPFPRCHGTLNSAYSHPKDAPEPRPPDRNDRQWPQVNCYDFRIFERIVDPTNYAQ